MSSTVTSHHINHKKHGHLEQKEHPHMPCAPKFTRVQLFATMFGKRDPSLQSSSLCGRVGFLQKNNNLDDKSRIVGLFNDQQPSKSIFTQDNERESRFRRTETDFSNLYARGEDKTFHFHRLLQYNPITFICGTPQIYKHFCVCGYGRLCWRF